jgi:cyclophilin family peptidyl-prolyl cis-trans isomerase
MIQGGGMTAEMKQKKTNPPIQNEAKNGLKNRRGSLSMARTDDVNSATSQFFVNVADNAFLDHRPGSYGYAVFAHVIEGMDVVDKIVAVRTGRKGPHDDVPLEPVVIESVSRVEG